MRNYSNVEFYLNTLAGDVYAQPEDDGHTALATNVIDGWMSRMTTCNSVLDVGCGTAFAEVLFSKWNVQYEGVCLGDDFVEAQRLGRNVKKMDFTFLDYEDGSWDLIFSRHSLEHSPMPLITLFEWARVARYWCGIVLPAPEWYTYGGSEKNHYSVMNQDQVENIARRAGWKVLWNDTHYREKESVGLIPHEYRYMLEKKGI